MSLEHYLALILVAGAVTLALTPLVRTLGLRIGAVARPGGRSVHEGLVPRIGGVAIFSGVMVALVVQWLGESFLGWNDILTGGDFAGRSLVGILSGLALVFLVGLVDDLVNLKPGAKLAGQVLAAAVVAAAGLRIDFIGTPFADRLQDLGLFSIPVTILYLVGFANVINLIDGLDGLAAGVSAIAATSLLVLAAQGNRLDAAVLAAVLIGACLGFLRYNFHPASIFMGDSGSMFLGFTLATISLMGVMKTTAAIALAVPLLIIGVPIFDTASAIVRRLRHKKPIHQADKGHIHHRLLGRGFGQRQTVGIIYLWSAALALGGYAVRYLPSAWRLLTFVILGVLSLLMAYWLGLYEAVRHHSDETTEGPKTGAL